MSESGADEVDADDVEEAMERLAESARRWP